MIIKKKLNEGVWCKYKGKIEFLIRLFKISELDFEEKSTAKTLLDNYMYCLVDWKGLTDEDDKTEFKCTPENKEYLYNYYNEIRAFVFAETNKQQDKLDKSIKKLKAVAEWVYDKDRVDCKKCIEFKQRQGLKPDCDKCHKVDLFPENNIVDYIMYWYGSTFIDGMGSINLPSIKEALVLENIEDKQLITKKLIIYLKAGLDAQHKGINDGK